MTKIQIRRRRANEQGYHVDVTYLYDAYNIRVYQHEYLVAEGYTAHKSEIDHSVKDLLRWISESSNHSNMASNIS